MAIDVARSAAHSIHSSTLADVLERVLDKGLVIAGDIKIKLVDIELLTIQIRLVVASVDKAREMGMDWWTSNSAFQSKRLPRDQSLELEDLTALRERITQLERGSLRNWRRPWPFQSPRLDAIAVTDTRAMGPSQPATAHDRGPWRPPSPE